MKSSVDEERKTMKEPLLDHSPKGGFVGLAFIIVNGMLEKVASYGLLPNMTLYLTNMYNMGMIQVSNTLLYWMAAINLTPVIGAILGDAYAGRFNMMAFGSVLGLLGMILLWLTAMLPALRPLPCTESNYSHCSSATIPQLLLLFTSFATIAIGCGGIRSCSLSFGVDQVENADRQKKGGLMEKFYGWYYATYMISILIGNTFVVYIQDKMGWQFGFGVSVVVMALATLCFLVGTPFYVKAKVKANLVSELFQVIFASCKKRHVWTSSGDLKLIYYYKEESKFFSPTERFRFLNKACILEDPQQELSKDGSARDPWSLCTVDQVEDLKALLKVIPIWSTGTIAFISMSQGSFSVLQAESMDRKIFGNFKIPAGSFSIFSLFCLALWVPIYDRVVIPMVSKIKGKPTHFSTKQRMGAGLFLAFVTMIVTALVESIRRSQATNPLAKPKMSALWIVPQYCLLGISEALIAIPQSEFFIAEFPKSMWSIASTLSLVAMSAASTLASFLMSAIDDITKRGGGESWFSTDLDKSHFDYYFWVLSGLGLLNFMYFLLCCWTYGPTRDELQKHKATDEEAVPVSQAEQMQ